MWIGDVYTHIYRQRDICRLAMVCMYTDAGRYAYICVDVYVDVCVHVCAYGCTHACSFVGVRKRICICMYLYIYIDAHSCAYKHAQIFANVSVYAKLSAYVCLSKSMTAGLDDRLHKCMMAIMCGWLYAAVSKGVSMAHMLHVGWYVCMSVYVYASVSGHSDSRVCQPGGRHRSVWICVCIVVPAPT